MADKAMRGGAAMRRSPAIPVDLRPRAFSTACWLAASLIVWASAVPVAASAQQYPSSAIRILVGFNPSSSADVVARTVGKHIEQRLGQPVVVENRPGNSSMIAAELVARAPNDGYTLFMATVANTIYPARTGAKFNLGTDMQPIALLGIVPSVLVVHPSVPANNMQELAVLMKAKPESLTYGTSGVGTASHLGAEMLNLKLGTKVVMAHYQGGSSQRLVDLMAGRITVGLNVAASLVPYLKQGSLKAMAVAQPKRTAILPDVPTLAEAGIPGVDAGVWIGLLAPAGTAPGVIDKLSAIANDALKSPDVIKIFESQGIDPLGNSPAEFAGFIRDDSARWAAVLASAGLRQ
jgi:tripartite-type tricarboxylate transporter receptor subunit TctC